MSVEKECVICATKEVYESLKNFGIDENEAFHMALGLLLEQEVANAIDEGFVIGYESGIDDGKTDGYDNGYEEACKDMASIVTAYAVNVSE